MRARLSLLLLVLAPLAVPAGAKAVIPSGNLLTNPGTEQGPAGTVYTETVVPTGWHHTSTNGEGPTALEYGAPGGFPSKALGASIGGGRSFFSGGLNTDPGEGLAQTVDASAAAPEIQDGQVQAAVTACLGGVDQEPDFAELEAAFWGDDPEAGHTDPVKLDQFVLTGPSVAERGGVTKFLPQEATGTVPRKTDYIVLTFSARQVAGIYPDGYADNLTLHLEPAGSPDRKAKCSAATVPPPKPGGGPTPGPGEPKVVPDAVKPAVLGLGFGSRRFRAAARGGSIAAASPVGTRVTYRLSEAATSRFTVERAARGVRKRKRCVRPKRGASGRRCTRYRKLRGSFSRAGVSGANSFKFTGRLRNRRLRPGRYRLVMVATDAAGNRSAAKRVKFRIVKR